MVNLSEVYKRAIVEKLAQEAEDELCENCNVKLNYIDVEIKEYKHYGQYKGIITCQNCKKAFDIEWEVLPKGWEEIKKRGGVKESEAYEIIGVIKHLNGQFSKIFNPDEDA